jgi:hypothetical protein
MQNLGETFKYCRSTFFEVYVLFIGPDVFIDSEGPTNLLGSRLQLGTYQHPYRMLDDAFRELFNRK